MKELQLMLYSNSNRPISVIVILKFILGTRLRGQNKRKTVPNSFTNPCWDFFCFNPLNVGSKMNFDILVCWSVVLMLSSRQYHGS